MTTVRGLQTPQAPAAPAAHSRAVAPREELRALSRAIGNRALTRLIAQPSATRRLMRETTKLPNGEDVWFEPPVTEAMVAAVAARITATGVTLDSTDAAKRTRENWASSAAAGVLERIMPLRWDYEDLLGIAQALEVAGHVRGLRRGTVASPGPTREPAWRWQLGKITGTVTKGAFSEGSRERRDQGETLTDNPAKLSSIALVGDCAFKNFELEPEPTGTIAEPAKDKRERMTRTARGIVVHEIGHTIYAAFAKDWLSLVKVQKDPRDISKTIADTGAAAAEPKPTVYAEKNDEEDFCESFMLYLLYPDRLKQRPLRWAWFKARAAFLDAPRSS